MVDIVPEHRGPAPCRSCGGADTQIVLDLGMQPSCEVFPAAGGDPALDPRHPLRMAFCHDCGLAQLDADPGTVEEQVLVVEPAAMVEQARRTLALLTAQGHVGPGRTAVEFASPHGGTLRPDLEAAGVRVSAPDRPGSADLVLDVYGLLHEPDQDEALRHRVALLRPGGALALQLHSLAAVLENRHVGELRHGHFAYWSMPALATALARHGLGVHRARRFPLDGGTVVVIARADAEPDAETRALLAAERAAGVTDATAVAALQQAADGAAAALRGWLDEQRAAGRRVVGYGAATRAVPVLAHAGVDAGLLCAIGDAAPGKQGGRVPGSDIPVVAPDAVLALDPDLVLLFLPDLLGEMRARMAAVEERGGRWVVLTPAPQPVAPLVGAG